MPLTDGQQASINDNFKKVEDFTKKLNEGSQLSHKGKGVKDLSAVGWRRPRYITGWWREDGLGMESWAEKESHVTCDSYSCIVRLKISGLSSQLSTRIGREPHQSHKLSRRSDSH